MSSITVKEYQRLKEAVEQKEKEVQRAQGAYDEGLKRLKTEFGCEDVQQAKEKLARLEQKEKDAFESFETKLEQFKKDFGDVLDQ